MSYKEVFAKAEVFLSLRITTIQLSKSESLLGITSVSFAKMAFFFKVSKGRGIFSVLVVKREQSFLIYFIIIIFNGDLLCLPTVCFSLSCVQMFTAHPVIVFV